MKFVSYLLLSLPRNGRAEMAPSQRSGTTTQGGTTAEPENRAKVTLQELMVVTLSMTDALSKLLIEKGVITDESLRRDRIRVRSARVDCEVKENRRPLVQSREEAEQHGLELSKTWLDGLAELFELWGLLQALH
jgi:hypothetical protein